MVLHGSVESGRLLTIKEFCSVMNNSFAFYSLQRWSRLQGSNEKGPGPVAGGLVVEPPSVVGCKHSSFVENAG